MNQEENKIGKNIKKFRTLANLTQKQLAQKCGLAAITIRQYESGAREPKAKQQEIICSALNIPPLALITGSLNTEENNAFSEGMREAFLAAYNGPSPETLGASRIGKKILESYYDILNDEGQEKAIEQVELLTKIPEYRKDTMIKPDDTCQPTTLAAHFDGDKYTDDEMDEIKQFTKSVKSKRKDQE